MRERGRRITMLLSEEEFQDVAYIAKSTNLSNAEFAKMALRQFLLNLRIAHIKLYLTILDNERQRQALRIFGKDNDIEVVESTFANKADADRLEDRLLDTGYDTYMRKKTDNSIDVPEIGVEDKEKQ
jgi:hypothetical protein